MDLKELKGHCEFMSQNSDIRIAEEHKLTYKLIYRYERLIKFINHFKQNGCWCYAIPKKHGSIHTKLCKEIQKFIQEVESE